MLKGLTQKLSRKRLNSRVTGSYNDLVALRKMPSTSEGLAHSSAGCISPATDASAQNANFSVAGLHAKDPQNDQHVLQADSKHLFAAVFTQSTTARGGHYLRQHLHMELLDQMRKHKNDLASALQAAIQGLNKDFTNLHPFNHNLLEGVEMAVAYVDFATSKLHVASNGSCRCVVGRNSKSGEGIDVVAEVGVSISEESKEGVSHPTEVATIQLSQRVDTIIIGSSGFWREVAPRKALLRMQCYHQKAPRANGGAAAAHLVNFALQRVTQRLKNHKDPRMASLNSVNKLLSLQTGDKLQYKWGSRQPVRRRRGDVHEDITVAVFKLDWEGRQDSFKVDSKKLRPALAEAEAPGQADPKYRSHWDLVRMHFLDFPRRESRQNRQQWASVVHAVLQGEKEVRKLAGGVAIDVSASGGGQKDLVSEIV